mmetsp:Transcript_55808/g.104695  ORF Transcript_55808/g.104695 Transcript_55808/m.104695 type:complete len:199 (-) Transcript_55808:165-761(-)
MSSELACRAYDQGQRILVGYSATNRSSCKHCGKAIGRGALRVGQLTGRPVDGIGPKWCHPQCFLEYVKARFAKPGEWFKKYVAESREIAGFGELTEDDQAVISELVDQGQPRHYVVTVSECDAAGELQLVFTNMMGDAVCPNLRAEGCTASTAKKHVARHMGRQEEVRLINSDATVFEGPSVKKRKRSKPPAAAIGGA